MSAKTGGPAFPDMQRLQMCKSTDLTAEQRETVYMQSSGMTLRDYFAAKAMQGMFSADTLESVIPTEKKAQFAYEMADAMLAERDK